MSFTWYADQVEEERKNYGGKLDQKEALWTCQTRGTAKEAKKERSISQDILLDHEKRPLR